MAADKTGETPGDVAGGEGEPIRVASPFEPRLVEELKIGDHLLISGSIYVARDAAHERLTRALDRGEELPFDIAGQTIYYAGPSPARPGRLIGSVGPTTSARMDTYTPRLLAAGLRAMIGKGKRSPAVREALRRHRAVYCTATGGAGALIAGSVRRVQVVAYDDMGPEAVLLLEVEDLPVIVANDVRGRDLFEEGRVMYEGHRR